MAKYYENRIILSAEESMLFRQRMDAPSAEAASRRDQNLDWIARHMKVETTPTGFVVSVPESALMRKRLVTTVMYEVSRPEEPMQLGSITSVLMKPIKRMSSELKRLNVKSAYQIQAGGSAVDDAGFTYEGLVNDIEKISA